MKTFTLILLTGVVCGAVAQGNSGNSGGNGQTKFATDDFEVQIPGGGSRPQYTFWATADADNQFTVSLEHLYEITGEDDDAKKVPSSEFSLNSCSWTSAQLSGDALAFELMCSPKNGDDFARLKFTNHIGGDSSSNDTSVKFDVELDSYKWTSETARLALVWSLKAKGKDAQPRVENDTVIVGNAFFSSSVDATAGGETVPVSLFLMQNNIVLAYDHFCSECELEHDPAFGVSGASSLVHSLAAMFVVALATVLQTFAL